MLQKLWRNILVLVAMLLTLTATYFSQVNVSQVALTQCLDNVYQPGCYYLTTEVRACCTHMGLPGYYKQIWNVQVWRHVGAPRSKWYWRESRIRTTTERCTPLPPLTCRPIP